MKEEVDHDVVELTRVLQNDLKITINKHYR